MRFLTFISILIHFLGFSQALTPTPSCFEAVDVCDSVYIYPNMWATPPNIPEIHNYVMDQNAYPTSAVWNIFPMINPLSPSHGPCLNNSTSRYWISLTIESPGWLEFYFIGGQVNYPIATANNTYKHIAWTLYRDPSTYGSTACDLIQINSNSLECLACNRNLTGPFMCYTGMSQSPGTLPLTSPLRREPAIWANSGDKFIILITCTTDMDLITNQPVYFPRAYFGNSIPGNENSTTTATFTCEPWTVPKNVCLGDSVWFELSNSYNGYDDTYTYTFLNNGNDVVDSTYAPWFQVLPTDTTTYFVEVSQNGTIYDTLSFTVNVTPPPTPNAGPDLFICEGDTALLTAQLSDTANYFLWQMMDTSDYLSASDSLSIAYASLPDTDFLVLFENNYVCPTAMDTVFITTQPTPQLSLLSDTTICVDGTANLEAVVTNISIANYTWSFSSDSSAIQNFSTPTSTWVSCIAIDSIGCSSEPDSVFITVLDSLNTNILLNYDYCEGESITLTSSATGGIAPYGYDWLYNGQSVGNNSTLNFTATGQDAITLILNDACETPMDSSILSFRPYPMPSVMLAADDSLLCFPGVVELSFQSSPLIQSWTWNLGDGNQISNQNPLNYTYNQSGIFDVSLYYATVDNCLDMVSSLSLEVVENPVASFSFNNEVSEFSTQVLFTNTSRFADYYYWTFENAQPATSTFENPTTNFEEGEIGVYEIQLIAFNNIGCSDTLVKTINIAPEFSLYAPNTFTPNGDQSNNTWSVYANGIDTEDFHLQIFNRHGTLIFESFDANFAWDGTYKGKLVQTGTYTWKIDVSTAQNAERLVRTGFVVVLY